MWRSGGETRQWLCLGKENPNYSESDIRPVSVLHLVTLRVQLFRWSFSSAVCSWDGEAVKLVVTEALLASLDFPCRGGERGGGSTAFFKTDHVSRKNGVRESCGFPASGILPQQSLHQSSRHSNTGFNKRISALRNMICAVVRLTMSCIHRRFQCLLARDISLTHRIRCPSSLTLSTPAPHVL